LLDIVRTEMTNLNRSDDNDLLVALPARGALRFSQLLDR
jgi:hypothetical protein